MDRENKLFLIIGPPEAGKLALAAALAQAFGDKLELVPRLTDKPPADAVHPAGAIRHLTPYSLRRHIKDGRLILAREGDHVSGFDRSRLDRILQKRNVILVTTDDGVRELRALRDDAGRPKYSIVIVRVIQPRHKAGDSEPPPSGFKADIEILVGVGPDPTRWAVRELSRHVTRLIA